MRLSLQRATSGRALTVDAASTLALNDGTVFSAADSKISAGQLTTGSNAVLAATGNSVIALGAAGLTNAGTLQSSGNLTLTTAPGTGPVTYRNAASGVIFGGGIVSIGDPALASSLTNEGTIAAADRLVVNTAAIANSGVLQANRLALNSATLANLGKDALIYGAGKTAGDMVIAARSISNQGTIWSESDLTLNVDFLSQFRPSAGTDPLIIGATRDLTINFSGVAGLAEGDYQAGRDLTFTGATRFFDVGSATDFRISGRDTNFVATPGYDLELGGGGWFATRNLTLSGDNLIIGGFKGASGAIVDVPDYSVTGGTGGTGTVALFARTGIIDMRPGSVAQSGADLTYSQPGSVVFGAGRALFAAGNLTVNASEFIENFGTMAGGTLAFRPGDGRPLSLYNRVGGILQGSTGFSIGTKAAPAMLVQNDGTGTTDADSKTGAPATRGIIFGGGFQIFTDEVFNRGLIVAQGGSSLIDTPRFLNDSNVLANPNGFNGTILSFFDTSAGNRNGTLTIETRDFVNRGLFAGTGVTTINAQSIINQFGAGLSAGTLNLNDAVSRYASSQSVDNQGEIFGGDVFITANTVVNGADWSIAANRARTAKLFAAGNLNIRAVDTFTNFNEIGAGNNINISGFGGSFANTRGLLTRAGLCPIGTLPDVDVCFVFRNVSSDRGALFRDLRLGFAGTIAGDLIVDGIKQYFTTTSARDVFGNPTEVFLDRRQVLILNEELISGSQSTSFAPNIFAGGNLQIDGFKTVTNQSGSIGAANNNTIIATGGTLTNKGDNLEQFATFDQRLTRKTSCDTDGPVTGPVSCGAVHDSIFAELSSGFVKTANGLREKPLLPATIFAGNTLSVIGGNVVNSGSLAPITAPNWTATAAALRVLPVGSPGLAPGATGIQIGGSIVTLPSSPNGRFVSSQTNDNRPLIETNPAFGIDSPALGSDYLVKLLGLDPDKQLRRLGDDNYEAYLIAQQVQAQTNKSVLNGFADTYSMSQALFDNAKKESTELALSYGTALTATQVAALTSDIVWMVEQEVKGQKVLVPVVYLSNATRAGVVSGASLQGYNVNLDVDSVTNRGGDIVALNLVKIKTTGNIENLSGRIAGYNVSLDAKGDIINETLTTRSGSATDGIDMAARTATIEATKNAVLKAGKDIKITGAWVQAGDTAVLSAGNNVEISGKVLTQNSPQPGAEGSSQRQSALSAGVVAGNSLYVDAKNDVITRGAILQADANGADRKTVLLPVSGDSYCQSNDCTEAERTKMNADRKAEIDRRDAEFAKNPTGVLSISAGRNVDIGTIELTDKSTRQESRSGTYDTLNRDQENMEFSQETGTEQRSSSKSQTIVTGIGSSLSGNRVQIKTGTGDVTVTGSDISSGEAGTIIDSGRNVNIQAFNTKTGSTAQESVDRQGFALKGNMDGVSSGLKASGSDSSSTDDQSQARVSTLDSQGRITIKAKGDIRNEGTQYVAADDIAFIGKTLTNTAAASTRTTTSNSSEYSTSAMMGMNSGGTGTSINNAINTANKRKAGASDPGAAPKNDGAPNVGAMGGDPNQQAQNSQFTVGNPEASLTISASGGKSSSSSSSSVATGTSLKTGGSIIYKIEDKASDTGTTMVAGQNIIIDAGSYENRAAADTSSTEDSSMQAGANVKGSINATAEAGIDVDAQGSGTRSKTATSTAVVGSMKAAGGVAIKTRTGDLTLEGTQIAAGRGGVSLDAKGDLNLNQANDTASKSGDGESGTARGGGRVSLVGAGGSVGGGASARSFDYNDSQSTARTVNITSGGGVSLKAGNDVNSQGTNIDAKGSVDITAGRDVNLLAAQSERRVTGRSDGGGADLTIGVGEDAVTSGGGTVNYERNRVDYTKKDRTGSTITSGGSFTVTAGRNADIEGAKIVASDATINVAGDFTMRSAQSTVVENTDLNSGRIEASGSNGGGVGGANTGSGGSAGGAKAGGGNIGVNSSRSKQDILTNSNATLTTTNGTTLNVGGNAKLSGATIDARGGVQGTIGGDLTIETRTDRAIVDQVNNSTYVGVAPTGGLGGSGKAGKAVEGVQAAGNQLGQTGLYVKEGRTTKDNQTIGTASGISGGANGIKVTVGGNTTLTGATNAGKDFDTKGTTTINSVDTFTRESSRDTKITGTVASVAGLDQGRTGDFAFNPTTDAAGPSTKPVRPDLDGGDPNRAPLRPIGGSGDRDTGIAPAPRSRAPSEAEIPLQLNRRPAPANGAPDLPGVPRPGPRLGNAVGEGPNVNAPNANGPSAIGPSANPPQLALLIPNRSDPTVNQGYNNEPSVPNVQPNRARVEGAANPGANPGYGAEIFVGNAAPNRNRADSNADQGYNNEPFQPNAQPNRSRADSNGEPNYSNEPSVVPNGRKPSVSGNDNVPLRPGIIQDDQQLVLPGRNADGLADRGLDLRPVDEARVNAFAGTNENKRIVLNQILDEIALLRQPGANSAERTALADQTLARVNEGLEGRKVTDDGVETWPLGALFVGEDDHANFNRVLSRRVRGEPGKPQTVEESTNRVVYFTPEQQMRQQVALTPGGKARFANGGDDAAPPTGQKIFVVLEDGRVIVGDPQFGVTQHSSLAGGKRVQMAGEITFDANGKVIKIDNMSGHYRVDNAGLMSWVARTLVPAGLVDNNTVLKFGGEDNDGLMNETTGYYEWTVGDPKMQNFFKAIQPQGEAPAQLPSNANPKPLSESLAQQPKPLAEQSLVPPPANDNGVANARLSQAIDPVQALKTQAQSLVEGSKSTFKGSGQLFNDVIANPLSEIIVFRDRPGNADSGKALLEQFVASLEGPKTRNGITEFPVQPKYVGEATAGLPHWILPGSGDEATVRYFSAEEQAANAVTVDRGGLRFAKGGKPETGSELIFVVDRQGRMIVGKPEDGTIHHSSLAAGEPVRMAGTLKVDAQGRIIAIANDSGHYRPSDEAFATWLRDNAAALPRTDQMAVTMKGGDARFTADGVQRLSDVVGKLPGADRGAPALINPAVGPRAGNRDTGPILSPKGKRADPAQSVPLVIDGSNDNALNKSIKPVADEAAPLPQAKLIEPGIKIGQALNDNGMVDRMTRLAEARKLSNGDVALIDENVSAATKLGSDNPARKAILDGIEASLAGPRVREDGVEIFPLQPQYVGEEVVGIDNWFRRNAEADLARAKATNDKDLLRSAQMRLEKGPVSYFDAEQQFENQIAFKDGRLVNADAPEILIEARRYLFVVTEDGRWISRNEERAIPGETNHSSLAAGKPVAMAGEIVVNDQGQLVSVSNKSGHYRPAGDALIAFAAELKSKGIGTPQTEIEVLGVVTGNRGFRAVQEQKLTLDALPPNAGRKGNLLGDLTPPASSVRVSDIGTGLSTPPSRDASRRNSVVDMEQPKIINAPRVGYEDMSGVNFEAPINPGKQEIIAPNDKPITGEISQAQDYMLRSAYEQTKMAKVDRDAAMENVDALLTYGKTGKAIDAELSAVARGLAGPTVRLTDGLTEFPLLPQYVGETLPGALNWFDRLKAIDARNADGQKIVYSTNDQQKAGTMAVKDGALAFPDGQLLMPGQNYMYVVTTDGRMIVGQQVSGVVHHSSLSQGNPILMGGILSVDAKGRLNSINNFSGHFRPSAKAFEKFVGDLQTTGLVVGKATANAFVTTTKKGGSIDVENAAERGNLFIAIRPTAQSEPKMVRLASIDGSDEQSNQNSAFSNRSKTSGKLSDMESGVAYTPVGTPVGKPPANAYDAKNNSDSSFTPSFKDLVAAYTPAAEKIGDAYSQPNENSRQLDQSFKATGNAYKPANDNAKNPVADLLPSPERMADLSRLTQSAAKLVPNDAKEAKLTIDAISRFGGEAATQDDLVRRMEQSIAGVQPRSDGLLLLPIQPQYVGENVAGFDFWLQRGASEGRQLDPIRYLNANQRDDRRMVIDKGQLVFEDQSRSMPQNGKLLFVVDTKGQIVADRGETGVLHHSSLADGKPVLFAGEMTFDAKGKLIAISNSSGHYRPSEADFATFVGNLKRAGFDFGSVAAVPVVGIRTGDNGVVNGTQSGTDNIALSVSATKADGPSMLSDFSLSVDTLIDQRVRQVEAASLTPAARRTALDALAALRTRAGASGGVFASEVRQTLAQFVITDPAPDNDNEADLSRRTGTLPQ